MRAVQILSDTGLSLFGPIIIPLRLSKLRTCVTLGVLDKLFVAVLLEIPCIYRSVKSVHLAERKAVLSHSPPGPMLMVLEVRTATRKSKSDIRRYYTEDLAMLTTPVESEPEP